MNKFKQFSTGCNISTEIYWARIDTPFQVSLSGGGGAARQITCALTNLNQV